MLNKTPQIYKVYKAGEDSLVYKLKEEWIDDGISPLVIDSRNSWEPFESDQYWINKFPEGFPYWSNRFFPVAPSGKMNARWSNLHHKHLRNLEEVGVYDGESFSIPIPYLYTSIYELKPLDVFEFVNDHYLKLSGGLLPKETKYILENHHISYTETSFGITISRLDDPENTYDIFFDAAVNIIGKMKTIRVYEPNET
jgi:hypothetical protein